MRNVFKFDKQLLRCYVLDGKFSVFKIGLSVMHCEYPKGKVSMQNGSLKDLRTTRKRFHPEWNAA